MGKAGPKVGSKISRASTCNLCGEKVMGGVEGLIKHGEEYHPDYYFTESQRKFYKKIYYNPITQKWHQKLKTLGQELNKIEYDKEKFFLEYGEKHLSEHYDSVKAKDALLGQWRLKKECAHCGSDTKFNYSMNEWPVFCSFTCSTTWYAEHTDRPQQALKTLKKRKEKNPDLQLRPNQIRYWLNKGFSEEEAKNQVKERQITNTLEKFIKRYGEELGLQKWNERQEKWLLSMKKVGAFKGFSNVSSELFSNLEYKLNKKLFYGKNENTIRLKERSINPDCLYKETKKIIEFYGDYWHANPKKYNASKEIKKIKTSDSHKSTAKEIWEHDAQREKDIIDAGYKLKIVWESDFTNNPDKVLNECLEFLNDESEIPPSDL